MEEIATIVYCIRRSKKHVDRGGALCCARHDPTKGTLSNFHRLFELHHTAADTTVVYCFLDLHPPSVLLLWYSIALRQLCVTATWIFWVGIWLCSSTENPRRSICKPAAVLSAC